ncbi:MAG: TetR/AcrR family transcriptional regulator, partial [Acidobacteriota bacterium]
MPRPKSFDVNEAVKATMEVFWSKGYQGTSIDDLTEATGVKRQSLYNALGEKKTMFTKALLKYDTEERRSGLAELESEVSGRGAIEYLFTDLVEHCSNDKTRRGCFLVNTALESGHDDDIQRIVDGAIEDFRSFFERSLRRGQEEGEIPTSVDVTTTASGLLG